MKSLLMASGVHVKLHHKNKNPLPKQYILIANHPSLVEDAVITSLFKVRFLVKREAQEIWFLGRLMKATEQIFVDRGSKEDRIMSREVIKKHLEQGETIVIFPEGGCKGRRVHLPFHFGVFDISLETGIPIVPLFTHYETQEDFEWLDQSILKKIWEIINSQNKTANFYLHDAIDPKQFKSKESYCHAVQEMYLQWQKKYLE